MNQDNNIDNKQELSLEDNIIDIPIPTDNLNISETIVEPINNVTPISEISTNMVKEENKEKSNAMVENKNDNDSANNKGFLPVFIIFGFFIILLISFPYISDYINKLDEKRKNEEFDEYKNQLNSPSNITETTDTKNNFEELYNNCGTKELFTNIVINYSLKENQCFKVNLNNTKNFIKYIPAVLEKDTKWSIYLGEKEIYISEITSTNTISNIKILDNSTIEMQEVDMLGNVVNIYNYDFDGNLIISPASE